MKIVYDNALLNSAWNLIDPHPDDDTAWVTDGRGVANTLDGRRETKWKVLDTWGYNYVTIEIDGTDIAAAGMTFDAVGLAGINAGEVELETVTVYEYSGGWSSVAMWDDLYTSGITNSLPAGTWVDLIFGMSSAHSVTTKLQIKLTFNRVLSTIGADFYLGQVFLGTLVDPGDPESGMQSPIEIGASIQRSEGGGYSVIGRPGRYEEWPCAFRALTSSERGSLRTAFIKSRGATRPIMFHTHRHTGVLDWTSWTGHVSGKAADVGGGYFGNINTPQMMETEISAGVWDVDVPIIRSIHEDDVV